MFPNLSVVLSGIDYFGVCGGRAFRFRKTDHCRKEAEASAPTKIKPGPSDLSEAKIES